MFNNITDWFSETFGDWTDEGEGMGDEAPTAELQSEQTSVSKTAEAPVKAQAATTEAQSAMSSLSALPFGIGGIFNKPLEKHMAEMEKFASEQEGVTEKLNAESAYGSAAREKPLATLAIKTQVTEAQSQLALQTAMTGREGGEVNKVQIEAEGERAIAASDKAINNKQQQALDAVYNAEYGRILQTGLNDIEVPGRFFGYL